MDSSNMPEGDSLTLVGDFIVEVESIATVAPTLHDRELLEVAIIATASLRKKLMPPIGRCRGWQILKLVKKAMSARSKNKGNMAGRKEFYKISLIYRQFLLA